MAADGSTHTFRPASQEEAFLLFEGLKFDIERLAVKVAPTLRALDKFEGATPTGPEWLVQLIQEAIREQYPDAIKAAGEWSDEDPLKVEVLIGKAA